MEESFSFAPLLLVIFLAFLVPILITRFKKLAIPIVVGEILAGVLIGKSGLNWVQSHDPVLDLLSEFGFAFLMFLSGMEIDFSAITQSPQSNPQQPNNQKKQLNPLQLGLSSFLFTLGLSVAVGFGLVRNGLTESPWMMALILSTTSLGIVLPVLKEKGLSSGRYGQTLLIAALIADFATMLLITIVVAELSHGLTLDILLIGILFVAFFFIYRTGAFFFNRLGFIRRAMEELSQATAQIKVRAAFTMLLLFVVLSEVLGTEIILGAFLAGAVVSLLRRPEDEELVSQLESIGFGFFIPIFFIMVGVNFNLSAIFATPEGLILIPVLLVAALAVKFIPAMIFRNAFGWQETIAAGALLSSRLSLIIAASAIGLRLGVISETINSVIILVAIFTVSFSPILFIRLLPPTTPEDEKFIVVTGGGEIGFQLAERLQAVNENVIIIDPDKSRVERATKAGIQAQAGNASQPDSQIAELLDNCKTLICTHANTEFNYAICHQAKTVFGIDHIVAHVSNPGEIERFEDLGIMAVNAALDRVALLELVTRNPAMYEILMRGTQERIIVEMNVHNPGCHGKTIRQLQLPSGFLILALRRNGELIIPHGDSPVELGDHLTVMGPSECIDQARKVFTSHTGSIAQALQDCY